MNKIAIVTMDYLPATGGVAVYWANLYKNLPHDRFILVAPETSNLKRNEEVIRVPFFFKYLWPKWLRLIFNLPRIFRQEKISLVIAAQVLPIGTVCYILKKLKFVENYHVSCHGMDLATLKGRKRNLAKRVLLEAQKVMVNSDLTASLVKSLDVSGKKIYKVRPCPNIIPDSDFNIKNTLSKKILIRMER